METPCYQYIRSLRLQVDLQPTERESLQQNSRLIERSLQLAKMATGVRVDAVRFPYSSLLGASKRGYMATDGGKLLRVFNISMPRFATEAIYCECSIFQ